MTPSLDAALAECDELNIALWVQDGKLSFRSGEFGFPDRLRDTLRTHRDELFALLSDDHRSHPEWVPFVARNLDVRWFEFPLVKDTAVLRVNQRPYYRLTAATWARFALASISAPRLSKAILLRSVRCGKLLNCWCHSVSGSAGITDLIRFAARWPSRSRYLPSHAAHSNPQPMT